MITIDEHVVFMAFKKTNCSLAFPWSKNIMDEHHVFFTFTINNCVKTLGEFSVRTLTKTTKKQCKLFTTVFIEQENNGQATRFHGIHR